MNWRDEFTERVTEVSKERFTGKEGWDEAEAVFFACAVQACVDAKTKMFAVRLGEKLIVVPGDATDDLWLYALDHRGGIRKVSAEDAERQVEHLVPSMPFTKAPRCRRCDGEFDGGDVVFSLMREGERYNYCWLHIMFGLRYCRGKEGGAIAYSFHATDEIDRQDPVVITKVMENVPRALEIMRRLLDQVVHDAKKLHRRGQLSESWPKLLQQILDVQRVTLRILKFTAERVLRYQVALLEAENVDAPG